MDNNFVKEITNIDEDFARWYTDIVLKAELADYADTKGCIAIKPYGYAIWENIQNYTAPCGFSTSDSIRFNSSPVPAAITSTSIPVSFSNS